MLSQQYSYKAKAKLNLFLHVLAKTVENFHELQSLVYFPNIYDNLTFTLSNSQENIIKATGEFSNNLPIFKDNSIYKVISFFQETFSLKEKIQVELQKNLPIGGGIGGGSSDTAITIMAMNDLFNLGLSFKDLLQIAVKFGSDVPVCLYQSRSFLIEDNWIDGENIKNKDINRNYLTEENWINIRNTKNKDINRNYLTEEYWINNKNIEDETISRNLLTKESLVNNKNIKNKDIDQINDKNTSKKNISQIGDNNISVDQVKNKNIKDTSISPNSLLVERQQGQTTRIQGMEIFPNSLLKGMQQGAVFEGKGELTNSVSIPELPILLINPKQPLLTKDVFFKYDEITTVHNQKINELNNLTFKDVSSLLSFLQNTKNDLTQASIFLNSDIANILANLKESGALLSRMSGSGSTCFAIYKDNYCLEKAEKKMRILYPNLWIAISKVSSNAIL